MNPEEDDMQPMVTSQPVPDAAPGCTCFDETVTGSCPVHDWDEDELDEEIQAWNALGAYNPENGAPDVPLFQFGCIMAAFSTLGIGGAVAFLYWITH